MAKKDNRRMGGIVIILIFILVLGLSDLAIKEIGALNLVWIALGLLVLIAIMTKKSGSWIINNIRKGFK